MKVFLEVSPEPRMPLVLMFMGMLCIIAILLLGNVARKDTTTEGVETPSDFRDKAANALFVLMCVFFVTGLGTAFSHEKHKMEPLEAAYAEQHGVTDMDAQVVRAFQANVLACLPQGGERSVSYEWTEADGTRKRGLLEKEFPYQGECEYTLTAVE